MLSYSVLPICLDLAVTIFYLHPADEGEAVNTKRVLLLFLLRLYFTWEHKQSYFQGVLKLLKIE